MNAKGRKLLVVTLMSMAAFGLPGCKTTSAAHSSTTKSTIDMRMLLPPGGQVMDVPRDKTFLMASPITEQMPTFPSGTARDTDVSVCVEIVVSEAGDIGSATPIYGLPECPLPQLEMDQRFAKAVTDAVEQWQFLAAAVCTFPTGVPKTDDCSGSGVDISPIAIKLSYVFSFKRNGRVTVAAKRA